MKRAFVGWVLAVCFMCCGVLEARTVYITRHGQVGDKKFRDTRIKEFKLTELGVEQSELLSKYLVGEEKFKGVILVSPFYRTIQTALPLARALDQQPILDPGFQEVAPHPAPEPRGMTKKEIETRFPGKVVAGPSFRDGWRLCNEGPEARIKRVAAALDRALATYPGDIIIVTHGGIVNTLVGILNDRRTGKVAKVRGTAWNCCLFVFDVNEEGKVTESEYATGLYMSDDKCTDNFRCPKIERPDDPRYRTRAQHRAIIRERQRREAEKRKAEGK